MSNWLSSRDDFGVMWFFASGALFADN